MDLDLRKNLLIIEDNELNREMLCAILSDEYNVIQAENGKIGLDLLYENKVKISLILLDIQMPVMNGYEFLKEFTKNPRFSNIPIIVTTSSAGATEEIHCLEMGATDFVAKPYNADVVLRRVNSMIRLAESSQIINRVEHDDLTDLYSKEFFYMHAEERLKAYPEYSFDIACCKIRSIKFIVERFGISSARDLIVAVANSINRLQDAICARIDDNVFAIMLPHQESKFYNEVLDNIVAAVENSPVPEAIIHFGVYRNVNRELSIHSMCDYAAFAIDQVKGRMGCLVAEYDEALKARLSREQDIVFSMENALKKKEFTVYYQPKFDLQENKVGGAEALIRWKHHEYGMLSPGEFIPIFEKNGFIKKLDFYIAEQVCSDLRKWIDAGIDVVPVSINVSRVDFEDGCLAKTYNDLVLKYNIPYNLIHIEVTESAYADNPDSILQGVKELHDYGFKIELDDFGAGYSSLKVLDELELDVLKLDMSLIRNVISEKREYILQCIFNLTFKLGMTVVAEGVETKERAEALKNMGCKYAQGYYYSKPIPKKEFEEYLIKFGK